MREVRIAGGGLAGLALAAGLRRHDVPVRVDEAGVYPRHRVCGEFVSGVAEETLERLGIAAAFADARRHRSVRWHVGGSAVIAAELPEPALAVSRFLLDQRLRELVVAAGGTVAERSPVRPEAAEGFVWAAGRAAAGGPWLGLKCHVHGLPMAADLEMHSGSNGYAGLTGVEDGRVNVCGMFRADRRLRGRGVELLDGYLRGGGLGELADRIAAREAVAGSFQAVAGFRLGRQPERPGWCVVGDAERMIPPFTGHGMTMALQAAECALDPLVAWSRGAAAWGECRATIACRLERRFSRRLRAACWMQPVLMAAAGRAVIAGLGRAGLLPFRGLLGLVR
jgi:2-polyprenyl-6-methoxyphenol hydroxylase-like FAD-dependent oxidoreductase